MEGLSLFYIHTPCLPSYLRHKEKDEPLQKPHEWRSKKPIDLDGKFSHFNAVTEPCIQIRIQSCVT